MLSTLRKRAFTSTIHDRVTLEDFNTQLGLNYYNDIIGKLNFFIDYNNINYGYDSVVLLSNQYIPNRIKTDFFGISASYTKAIKKINLNSDAKLNLSEEFKGHYLNASISFNVNDDVKLNGGISINSRLPNYNYLLFQNDYVNYNWYNIDTFKNINKQSIYLKIKSQKYLNLNLGITNIKNYTYFNLEDTSNEINIIKPKQYQKTIQYVKLKANREFHLGNFALDNTMMYQNVVSDQDILNVPTFITRNTFYYSNQIFKKAMTLQTGITFNYFTEYNMNGYDPLLAEFYTQNNTKLGGFPRLDFFIDAKIRQTRIFFKAEHFNSSFTGYDYFSAPNHPYRDFTIRFGLIWDFFL